MVLKIHHLTTSQSERILWLCEELELPYELVIHDRQGAGHPPPELIKAHRLNRAPVIEDDSLGFNMVESGGIIQYILATYGEGRLTPSPSDSNFALYLQWFHFANATLLPAVVTALYLWLGGLAEDSMMMVTAKERIAKYLRFMDDHLSNHDYFAGDEFTAADIMNVFPVTTMRSFYGYSLEDYPHIVKYLQERIGTRPAWKKMREKGEIWDPQLLQAEPPMHGFARRTTLGWLGTFLVPVRMVTRMVSSMFYTGPGENRKSKDE